MGGMYAFLCTVHLIAGRQLEKDCNTVPENPNVTEHSKISRKPGKSSHDVTQRLHLQVCLLLKTMLYFFKKGIHSAEMFRAGRN